MKKFIRDGGSVKSWLGLEVEALPTEGEITIIILMMVTIYRIFAIYPPQCYTHHMH